MSNIQTGAERMPHDLSHLGFLAGQIGRLITISTTPVIADRKSGSAGMPRPISYAVFCLKKKNKEHAPELKLATTSGDRIPPLMTNNGDQPPINADKNAAPA